MVLVDSSVWIGFFKGDKTTSKLNQLIDYNDLVINDLILAELVPSLKIRRENDLVEILLKIEKIKIEIDWNNIIEMQVMNIRNGINKVGIADLIIAQNAIDNNFALFSIDKHFELMSKVFDLKLMKI